MNNEWQGFRLVPDDVLFFRDSKPSTRGADHYLRSLFPPHPATLYGALRTRRLVDEGVRLTGLREVVWARLPEELRRELGEWGSFGTLELRGPWLLRGGEVLVPAPADLGLDLAERRQSDAGPRRRRGGLREPNPPAIEQVARFRLWPEEDNGGHSHGHGLFRPWLYNGKGWDPWPGDRRSPRPATGWYLTQDGLARWRSGGAPKVADFVHSSSLWTDEARTGLGLEETERRHEDHMLYTFGYVRLRPGVSIGFEARGTQLAAGRRVRLGGEGRTCLLEEGPSFPGMEPKQTSSAGRLRVALVTPALSSAGGYPPGQLRRLLGGVVNGFVLVGGWDLANQRAKPLRRALPAGSVFVVESSDAGSVKELDGSLLSDFNTECLAAQGFGLIVAGVDF